jgi:hypothetical protein
MMFAIGGPSAFVEAVMDRFVNRQNIERYRRLREASDAAERRQIMRSLAEERAEFKLEFRRVDPQEESQSSECRTSSSRTSAGSFPRLNQSFRPSSSASRSYRPW